MILLPPLVFLMAILKTTQGLWDYYVFTVLTIGKDAADDENRLFLQVMGSIS